MPPRWGHLVIAKLDRLSRDAHFLLGLQKAGVRFVAADMPEANEMVVGIMAVVAQAERRMISERTKAALAAAKARGVKLGGDRGKMREVAAKGRAISLAVRRARAEARRRDLAPMIAQLRAQGATSLGGSATRSTRWASKRPAAAGGALRRCGRWGCDGALLERRTGGFAPLPLGGAPPYPELARGRWAALKGAATHGARR